MKKLVQNILTKINELDPKSEEWELVEAFDEIKDEFNSIAKVMPEDAKTVLDALFAFHQKQEVDDMTIFSFIHLVEKVAYSYPNMYYQAVITFNNKQPSCTSLMLLNRILNSLENSPAWHQGIVLLDIIRKNNPNESVSAEAQEYYEYQVG